MSKAAIPLFLLLFLAACGRTESQEESTLDAQVSADQAQKAFQIVKGIDYLPFSHAADGCYARALYMSMELAVQQIPSSAHYIYGDLRPKPGVTWTYHVAPLIKVDKKEAIVLDPSLEQDPLPVSKWIQKNFPNGSYQTEIKAGSAYFDKTARTQPYEMDSLLKNFKEFPKFLSSDIEHACSALHRYMAQEKGANVKEKQTKLLAQTKALIQKLKGLSKFEADDAKNPPEERTDVCTQAIAK